MAYTRNTWEKGELISALKLNNIEEGITGVDTQLSRLGASIEQGIYDNNSGQADITIPKDTNGDNVDDDRLISARAVRKAIENLDYADTADSQKYVSEVDEVDGKISVSRVAFNPTLNLTDGTTDNAPKLNVNIAGNAMANPIELTKAGEGENGVYGVTRLSNTPSALVENMAATPKGVQNAITAIKGQANGLAELDSNGLVPSSQLPSYVDDVLEFDDYNHFPMIDPETGNLDSSAYAAYRELLLEWQTQAINGEQPSLANNPEYPEEHKIYVAKDTGYTYRWSGSTYAQLTLTPTAINAIIDGLDVDNESSGAGNHITGFAQSKTLATLTETNGIIGATFQDIQIAESQVTDLNTHLDLKAPLASPALTGTPTAPTATSANSSTQIATTAFVMNTFKGENTFTDEHFLLADGTAGKMKDSGKVIADFATAGHTHETTIATSTGTSQLTLAYDSKYSITAGGTSYIFTMPSAYVHPTPPVDPTQETSAIYKITVDGNGHVLTTDTASAADIGALPIGTTAAAIGALPSTTTAADLGALTSSDLTNPTFTLTNATDVVTFTDGVDNTNDVIFTLAELQALKGMIPTT